MKRHTRALVEKMFPGFYGKVEQALYQNMATTVPTNKEVDEIFWFLLGNISLANILCSVGSFSKDYAKLRKEDPQLPIIFICGKAQKEMRKKLNIK